MKVVLSRVDEGFHFEGSGSSEVKVHIDGSTEIGGQNEGVRPMELVLMGLGSCGAMDIISILKKQKQNLIDLKITIDAERDKDNTPSVFTEINIEFLLFGNLDEDKVSKAVNLSMQKYCSVSAMLGKTALISYSYQIIKTN
ncbi:MAG: OsmC family protein [Melioribacteraceae bacterium]|nr:OsmC family protein [Melioribacteraceae bacterium]